MKASLLRSCLALLLGFGLSTFVLVASAQQYPNRPIKFIVPVVPGGGVDIFARTIAIKLTEQFGVPVVVENRGGAAGVIGSEALVNSAPDGYTIMMGYSGHATNPLFVKKLPYDTVKDFAPVVLAGYSPLLLVVNPGVAAETVKELIALAKSRPGKLDFASGGRGGGPFMAGLLLRHLAGVDIVHVPYQGNAPALRDVLGGTVTMMFDTINTSVPQVKAGRLRPLAVTSPKRSALAPEVPTMIEAGIPGFEVYAWFIVLAPARTPAAIVQRLNAEINKSLSHPELRARLGADGVEIVGGTAEEANAFLRSEMTKWKTVVEAANLKDE